MNTKKFPKILSAVYGQPWAITEPWLDTIAGIVEAHVSGNAPAFVAKSKKDQEADDDESPLQMIGSTAIIPVNGPIIPKANWMSQLSGATSSQEVSELIDLAVSKQARQIIFHIDSPGGAVTGGFEVANKIASLSIPTVAMIEGMGASLAYLWAAQCDEVCISMASIVGSVSVVMRMASDDRAMRNEGVDFVTIKSGNLKQAGDPASLAFAGQYQSLLSQLDTYHQMFVSMVGTARPEMDMAKVSTGDIWIGQKAVAAGLADRICSIDDVLSGGRSSRSPSSASRMAATHKPAPPVATAPAKTEPPADWMERVKGFLAVDDFASAFNILPEGSKAIWGNVTDYEKACRNIRRIRNGDQQKMNTNTPPATNTPATPGTNLEARIAELKSQGKYEETFALLPASEQAVYGNSAKTYATWEKGVASGRIIHHDRTQKRSESESEADMNSLDVDCSKRTGFKEYCDGVWAASEATRNEFAQFKTFAAFAWHDKGAQFKRVFGMTLTEALNQN